MTFAYSVTLSDPTGALSAAQAAGAVSNLRAALDIYARSITGQGTIDVLLEVDLSGRAVGSGASVSAVAAGATFGGKTVLYEGAVAELRSGVDPNGTTTDIRITLPPSYLANVLWLDPDPGARSAPVQAGRFDAVSFFLHELGHAFGFNGRGADATGVVSGAFVSTYDTFVIQVNGKPFFNGPNAVAAYGGPVPLSDGVVNSYTHYGQLASDGLNASLMEGATYTPVGGDAQGGRWYLDTLDLAILRDIGLTTVTAPIADAGGSRFTSFGGADTVTGGAGNDSLIAGAGADQMFGEAGDDSITATSGSNYLRGGEGNDVIIGGSDFDDINGNQGNDTLRGGEGFDWVVGGKDNDLLLGQGGGDIVYGNLGNDTVLGGDGNDWVRGGQGADSVDGGAGDDLIWGDRGDDTVTGGAGADAFHFFVDGGLDRVTDFNYAQGDRVILDGAPPYTVRQEGGDTVIDLGGVDRMVLVGVTASTLPAGWINSG